MYEPRSYENKMQESKMKKVTREESRSRRINFKRTKKEQAQIDKANSKSEWQVNWDGEIDWDGDGND